MSQFIITVLMISRFLRLTQADVSPLELNQSINPLLSELAYRAASLQKLMTATLMFPSCLTNVIPHNLVFMDGLLRFKNDSAVKRRRRPSPQRRSRDS